MADRIETISLEGPRLRVMARDPLPVEPRILALGAAVRVFERYPLLRRLTLVGGGGETTVTREDVERRLGPRGFAAVKDADAWRQFLVDADQTPPAEGTG